MIKLDIITGFLGAGKTTFINKYLKHLKDERVVVLINDFAEESIDESLVAAAAVRKLSDGCVCCTLKREFIKEIENIVRDVKPDRIIFESSGVFMLTENLKKLKNIKDLEINSVVCIVDGVNFYLQKADYPDFVENQIIYASRIIISKIEESVIMDSVIGDIRFLYEGVPVTAKPYDEFTDEDFDLTSANAVDCFDFKAAHPAPLCYSKRITREFSPFMQKQIIKNFKANRYGTVIRAKGILKKEGGGYCLLNVIANNAVITDLDVAGEMPRIAVMGGCIVTSLLKADFY